MLVKFLASEVKTIIIGHYRLNRILLLILIVVLSLGQPNGMFLLFPPLNLLLSFVVLLSFFCVIITLHGFKITLLRFLFYLTLFFIFSFFSLAYAEDKMFGVRIFSSVIFKIIAFFTIVRLITDEDKLIFCLKIISYLGALYAISGIIITSGVMLGFLHASASIGEVEVGGGLSYNQALEYYSCLGFVRSSQDLLGLIYPRLQSFFIEPGYFAFFIELSIFSTYAAKRHFKLIIFKLLMFCQILALLMSLSLAGIVCCLFGAFLVYFWRQRENIILYVFNLIKFLGVMLFGLSIFYVLFPGFISDIFRVLVLERFSVNWGYSSADVRSDVFFRGVELLASRPIFGYGFNQVRVVTQGIGLNNSFLTVAVEGGILGLTLYSIVIIYIVRVLALSHRLARCFNGRVCDWVFPISAIFCSLTLHCVFMDTNWTFIYWISIALVFACYQILHDKALNDFQ